MKSKAEDKDRKIAALQFKFDIIEQFVEARNLSKEPNNTTWIDICEHLLKDPNIDVKWKC